MSLQPLMNRKVLIRYVPKAGNRTSQVHFTKEIAEDFFGFNVGIFNNRKEIKIRQFEIGGTPKQFETRPLVYALRNKNCKLEVSGAKFLDHNYPEYYRPIIIFEEVGQDLFNYLLLIQNQEGYAELSEHLNNLPKPRRPSTPFEITTLGALRTIWPDYPIPTNSYNVTDVEEAPRTEAFPIYDDVDSFEPLDSPEESSHGNEVEQVDLSADVEDFIFGGLKERNRRKRYLRRISDIEFAQAKKTADEVGRLGEELVERYLTMLRDQGNVTKVEWYSDEYKMAPFDFRITDANSSLIQIDVKSTKYGFDKNSIHISWAELKEMAESQRYDIYRVFEVDLDIKVGKLRIAEDVGNFARNLLSNLEPVLDAARVGIDSISVPTSTLNFDVKEINLDLPSSVENSQGFTSSL